MDIVKHPSRRTRVALLVAGCLTVSGRVRAQGDSLDLAAALTLARARSPRLAAADAASRSAAGQVVSARAARGPTWSSDALYLRFDNPPAASLGQLGRLAPIPQLGYFVQVGVQQPLYTGGRVGEAIRAARWGERASNLARAQTEVEVTAAVAHAHDAALLAQALAGVADEGARVLDSAVAIAESNYEAGTVSRLDVLRAETRRAAAQSEVRAARDAAVTAREQLAALIGIDPSSGPPVAGRLEPATDTPDPSTRASLLVVARRSRPDIEALDAAARAAERRASLARASLRPTVALFVSNLTTRPELITARKEWSNDWYGGAIASWRLFDFGAAAGGAESAMAEATRARSDAQRIADEASATVLSRLRDLDRANADISTGRENVGRAQRALAIAQDRYAEGAGIQFEVLEAQADLVKTRGDLLRAIHAHRSAAVELRRAIGRPADAPLIAASAGHEGAR